MGSKAIKMKDIEGNSVYPCPYYPIGSIYMSVNDINPVEFFGGTWEQIKDKFLLSCGDTYKNGSTGGSSIIKQRVVGESSLGLLNGGAYLGEPVLISDNGYYNNMPPYLVVYVWKRTA